MATVHSDIKGPNKLWLSVTNRCNLACKHCLPDSRVAMAGELSAAEIYQLIEDAEQLGVKRFAFTGGEPLLHPELLGFVEEAHNRGMRTYVETNSTRTTSKNLERLQEAGMQVLNLSLDSADPGQHNALRGGENYAKVLRTAFSAVEMGLDVRVYCTVTRPSLAAARQLASLFVGMPGRLGVLTFSYFSPLGRGALNTDLSVPLREWKEFCAHIETIREALEPQIGPIRYEPATVPRDEYYRIQQELGYDIECIARGRDYVYVNPIGHVYGCAVSIGSLPPLGNIRSSSLQQIWLHSSLWKQYAGDGCGSCPAFKAARHDKSDYRLSDLPEGDRLICPMMQYPKIESWVYEREQTN